MVHQPPDEVVARECLPSEIDAMLTVRNAIFPPVTRADWERGEPATASVATIGDRMEGGIPLTLRRFQAAPGRSVRVAFENAVGTLPEARSHGVGLYDRLESARRIDRNVMSVRANMSAPVPAWG